MRFGLVSAPELMSEPQSGEFCEGRITGARTEQKTQQVRRLFCSGRRPVSVYQFLDKFLFGTFHGSLFFHKASEAVLGYASGFLSDQFDTAILFFVFVCGCICYGISKYFT